VSKIYWQLFYHFVWKTKNRLPLISEEVGETVLRCIRRKCDDLACTIYAIETVSDHVHMLVSVPPSISLSDFIMNVKGASSHLVNHSLELESPFSWQRGCGVLTISGREKPRVIEYIQSQQRRHESGELWASLECTESDGPVPEERRG